VLINLSISRFLANMVQVHFFFYAIPRGLGKGRNDTMELNRKK